LIVFNGVSAENVGAGSNNKKAIKEITMVHPLMVRSFFPVGTTRLPQAGENVQLGFQTISILLNDAEPATASDC
jgi:hypothetical protein